MYKDISLSECVDLIATIGDKVTVFAQGHIGTGKSSMRKMLSQRFPDYYSSYVDCTNLDVGDLAIPKVNGDVTTFVPNEMLGLHLNKPIILMFDELSKASSAVKKAVLRILLERAHGTRSLPEGSIVFATGNLALEGVADLLEAHARNRMCVVKVRKYIAMEWVERFAIHNDIDPIVIGTALEYPQMFQSFEDVEDPANNLYIHHPKSPRAAFVTPRSMEQASHIIKATRHLPDDVRIHALMGVVGEAAAMDMMTMAKLDDELPGWERLIKDPENVAVPKSGVASCMLVAKAVMRVEKETFGSWMTFCKRMPKEAQALFARTIMGNPKNVWVAQRPEFTAWAESNIYLFG